MEGGRRGQMCEGRGEGVQVHNERGGGGEGSRCITATNLYRALHGLTLLILLILVPS
jgi:hypothetical protein